MAAFFCEPVIGAGGVHPPPEGYIQGVADLCAEHGILLVIDSVICGFGRLGTWFGVERWEDVKPGDDHVRQGRHVRLHPARRRGRVASEIAAPYWAEPGGPTFRHGATYAGHPVACAAALAVIDIYEREELIPRGRELEQPLYDALAQFASHPAVGEVRGGCGFLAAVGVAPDADPGAAFRLADGAREAGVLVAAAARRDRGVAAADLRPVAPRPARGGRRGQGSNACRRSCNPYRRVVIS